jgi:hypothetical protein
MCGINQLSTGAYLLRGDLFPAIISVSELCLFLSVVGSLQTLDNQGTRDREVHVRGVAFAYTLVQLSQDGCGKAQPFPPPHRRNHGR